MLALRCLAIGAALLVLPASLDDTAVASVSSPARSLRALGGRPVWVPICGRRGVNGSGAYYDNVNIAVMDQVMCYSPSWGTVAALKLVYAAFDMPQQGEVDRPITATIANASIFVPTAPANNVLTSVAFASGANSLQCSPTTVSGCNAVSAGQYVTGPAGSSYFSPGTYITSVTNSFATSGNTPTASVLNLSAPTLAANAGGLLVTYIGQIVPARFGGRVGVVIAPAHDVVTSDPVTITIPPTTQFFIRTAAMMSGVGLQIADMPGGYRYTGANNEFDSRSTALNDHTLDPTNLSNTGGGFWGPSAVVALVTPAGGLPAPGAVLILGDSIAAGTGDVPDALQNEGYIERSLANNVPFVSAARGSTNAGEEAMQGNGQMALATDTGITDVLLELDRNDIWETHTAYTIVEGYIETIASRYAAAGKRVWCFTATPTTDSTDGWTTLVNQSWSSQQLLDEAQRELLNADLRTPAKLASLGCYGLIDVAGFMEDPGGSHKWRVDYGAASADGVHPSAALHLGAVSAGLIKASMFTIP
jgi:hypothetical protein